MTPLAQAIIAMAMQANRALLIWEVTLKPTIANTKRESQKHKVTTDLCQSILSSTSPP
jgi:hypothetical protein